MREHPFAYLRLRSDARKCCTNTKNLVVFTPRPDLKVAICKRCMTKHQKLWCEPGTIFAKHLQAIGRPLLDFPHRRILRGSYG